MRVVLHFNAQGQWSLLSDDPSIEILVVDDACPADRVYRMTTLGHDSHAIAELICGEPIGEAGKAMAH